MTTFGGSDSTADFVIVTPLEEERDAVLNKLIAYQQLPPSVDDVRIYYSTEFDTTLSDGSPVTYRLALMSLLGMGRVEATAATSDAIRRWHPRYVIIVGIAGGFEVNGVKLGDVLIADQIADYELQKIAGVVPEVRWNVHRSSPRLLGAARAMSPNAWFAEIGTSRPADGQPKRHIGPIASGDKVVAFSDLITNYRNDWPKLIGVEMEAGGVATATFQAADSPEFFMIRGVSDLADPNKNTENVINWRSYACDEAASYLVALLRSGPITPDSKNKSNQGLSNSIAIVQQSEINRELSNSANIIASSSAAKRSTTRPVFQPNAPIGRDGERDECITLLRNNRVLLLYGAPGQGKTELARYIGTTLENDFQDGIFEVDLQNEKQIDNVVKYIGDTIGSGESSKWPISHLFLI